MPHPMVSRLAYVPWSISRIHRPRFRSYVATAAEASGISRASVISDIWRCLYRYETTPMDYFYFRFFALSEAERAEYASSLQLHNFQHAMNTRAAVAIAGDKAASLRRYSPLVARKWFNLPADSARLLRWLRGETPARVVVKNPMGVAGRDVRVAHVKYSGPQILIQDVPFDAFVRSAVQARATLVEQHVEQHPDMAAPSPDAVNTIRVITRFDGATTRVVSAILRLGWGGEVDNFDAGGVSVWLSEESGTPTGPPVVKDPFRRDELQDNPVLTTSLSRFTAPHWARVIDATRRACSVLPGLRTAGWDFAVTPQGPELIEVNHNWDKTHWQISEGRGRAEELKGWWRPA